MCVQCCIAFDKTSLVVINQSGPLLVIGWLDLTSTLTPAVHWKGLLVHSIMLHQIYKWPQSLPALLTACSRWCVRSARTYPPLSGIIGESLFDEIEANHWKMKHTKLYLHIWILYFTACFIGISLQVGAAVDESLPRLDCQLDCKPKRIIICIFPNWYTHLGSPTDDEVNRDSCTRRGCIWDETRNKEETNWQQKPTCYLDLSKVGYHHTDGNVSAKSLDLTLHNELTLQLINSSKLSAPKFQLIEKLVIKFIPITENILRFQIVDPNDSKRYQVPIQDTFPLLSEPRPNKFAYTVEISSNGPQEAFGFKVIRNDNHNVV